MKKILALVIAMMMVLAVMAPALADPAAIGNGNTNVLATANSQITIPKTITVSGSLDKVYSPNVTYTFTIAPVEPAKAQGATYSTVNDGTNSLAHVKAGVDGSASITGGSFTSAETALTGGQATVTQNLTVTIDPTKFTAPGIYRYVITDTTTAETLYNAGISRPDGYDTTRYLDVYVRNANSSGFEVYGYVLCAENKTSIDSNTTKDAGFDEEDTYKTVDVKVVKEVTGTMGDQNHDFPFSVTISNSNLNYYVSDNTALTSTSGVDANGIYGTALTTQTFDLKDSETYYIYGLNPKATVSYTETNDTEDIYKVSITDKDNSAVNSVTTIETGKNGTQTTGTLTVTDYNTTNSSTTDGKLNFTVEANNNSEIKFTNNLEQVSPTGVVLRFGPYLIMAAAAVVLLVMASRRRKDTQDKSNSI